MEPGRVLFRTMMMRTKGWDTVGDRGLSCGRTRFRWTRLVLFERDALLISIHTLFRRNALQCKALGGACEHNYRTSRCSSHFDRMSYPVHLSLQRGTDISFFGVHYPPHEPRLSICFFSSRACFFQTILLYPSANNAVFAWLLIITAVVIFVVLVVVAIAYNIMSIQVSFTSYSS